MMLLPASAARRGNCSPGLYQNSTVFEPFLPFYVCKFAVNSKRVFAFCSVQSFFLFSKVGDVVTQALLFLDASKQICYTKLLSTAALKLCLTLFSFIKIKARGWPYATYYRSIGIVIVLDIQSQKFYGSFAQYICPLLSVTMYDKNSGRDTVVAI